MLFNTNFNRILKDHRLILQNSFSDDRFLIIIGYKISFKLDINNFHSIYQKLISQKIQQKKYFIFLGIE